LSRSNVSLLSQVTTVVFDKTGTITHGRPSVASVALFAAESVFSLRECVSFFARAYDIKGEVPLLSSPLPDVWMTDERGR